MSWHEYLCHMAPHASLKQKYPDTFLDASQLHASQWWSNLYYQIDDIQYLLCPQKFHKQLKVHKNNKVLKNGIIMKKIYTFNTTWGWK